MEVENPEPTDTRDKKAASTLVSPVGTADMAATAPETANDQE